MLLCFSKIPRTCRSELQFPAGSPDPSGWLPLLSSIDRWVCMPLAMPVDRPQAIPRHASSSAVFFPEVPYSFGGLLCAFHSVSDDVAKDFRSLDVLKTDVEIYGGLDVAMAQQPSREFILTGSFLEQDCRCCVPELMRGDPQAGRLENTIGYLEA